MIVSGRCHGPGCQQAARVEYWCSEACQARWNATLTMATPAPGYHPGGWVDPPAGNLTPFAEVDLAPFQEAMSRTVRLLAEATQLPSDLLGNDSDTPERTIAIAWGQPSGARPPFPLRDRDGSGERDATYPLVASENLQVAQSGMRGWLGRWIHRKRRTR